MNRQIETRLATLEDRSAITEFIRSHWSASHVFVEEPDLFDWQYAQNDGRVNMVIAVEGGIVLGILGFIPMGRFDPALGDDDILLALWKVRSDLAPPGLGLLLLKFIQSKLKPRLIGAIGITEMVVPIYRALGYRIERLRHTAIFPPDSGAECRIATGVPDWAFAAQEGDAGGWRLERAGRRRLADMSDMIGSLAQRGIPRKSWAYINERYLEHPFYTYEVGLIFQGEILAALAIWRRVECNGSHILRIVDIIGSTTWLACGRVLLAQLVVAEGAEYIDLMQTGSPDELLREGGWLSPDGTEGLVLPNYFSPFQARNVQITMCWRHFGPETGSPRFYRADSDQDRPNLAPVRRRGSPI